MSVGFAGARDLDDRRRRRLAQNAEAVERRPPARPVVAPTATTAEFAASPIESVVRPQVWVNLVQVLLALGLCSGALWLGEWTSTNYPAAAGSFGPQGLLLRALPAMCFLFGAQLAAAIHWYRARSRKDFNGRYRVWHFVVPSLLAFGFCAATDAHLVFAHWAQARWNLAGEHAETLLWMVPAGTVLLAMIRLLQTEMRGTGGAAPSLWLATLAAVVNAAVLLKAPAPIGAEQLQLIGRSAAVFWPLGLLLALQVYARRVIYVTNEPCALPPSELPGEPTAARSWLTWWRPRATSERAAKNPARSVTDKPARLKPAAPAASPAAIDNDTPVEPRRPAAADAPAPLVAQPPRPAPALANPARTAVAPAVVTSPTVAERSLRDEPAAERTDESHDEQGASDEDDDDRYRGLSKKERKKLRKLHQRERRNAFE